MNGTISYLDAWSQWFAGQEVDKQLYLGPMTILWWSRTGKISAFIGGAVVILDIVGPERMRAWARNSRLLRIAGLGFTIATVAALLVSITGIAGYLIREQPWQLRYMTLAFLAILILLGLWRYAAQIGKGLGWTAGYVVGSVFSSVFLSQRPGDPIRAAGVALVFIGFHFDLLAS